MQNPQGQFGRGPDGQLSLGSGGGGGYGGAGGQLDASGYGAGGQQASSGYGKRLKDLPSLPPPPGQAGKLAYRLNMLTVSNCVRLSSAFIAK